MNEKTYNSGEYQCSACEEFFEVMSKTAAGSKVYFSPCCGAKVAPTLRKGDVVSFGVGRHKNKPHTVLEDEHVFFGRRVVLLEFCEGAVPVQYLKLVKRGEEA